MWHKIKIVVVALCFSTAAGGQSVLCTRDMIRQQISVATTLPFPNQRITTLIRAADLLWPYQEDRARAALTDAFEMATELEKENDEQGPRTLILRMQYPDQRYVVIRAVAKRDPRWAKELTRRMLREGDASPNSTEGRSPVTLFLNAEVPWQAKRWGGHGGPSLQNATGNLRAS